MQIENLEDLFRKETKLTAGSCTDAAYIAWLERRLLASVSALQAMVARHGPEGSDVLFHEGSRMLTKMKSALKGME